MADDGLGHNQTGNGYDNVGAYPQEVVPQPYLLEYKYPDTTQPHSEVRSFMMFFTHPLKRLQATSLSHYPGNVPPWRAPGLYSNTQEQHSAAPFANQTSPGHGGSVWHTNTQHGVPFTPATESTCFFPESSPGQLTFSL